MIVYYITAHGFGHLVRACAVLRALRPELPLTVRTTADAAYLQRKLAGRAFTLAPAAFDCGTLGPDSTAVDPVRTLDALEPLLIRNRALLDAEAQWLQALGARAIVSDIPSFALAAARRAGIPSLLVTNFIWPVIYRHLADREINGSGVRARLLAAIDAMQTEYDSGDLLLVPGLDVPFRACHARRTVGVIAEQGRPRKAELAAALGMQADRPIYLVYLGAEGRQGMQWDRLAALTDGHGPLQLAGFTPPEAARRWIRPIPEGLIDEPDLFASVDGVIAKPGYSTASACMAHGTPLLTTLRPQFVEAEGIARALEAWGGGAVMPEDDFLGLNWAPWLGRMEALRAAAGPVDACGAAAVAQAIEQAWQTGVATP